MSRHLGMILSILVLVISLVAVAVYAQEEDAARGLEGSLGQAGARSAASQPAATRVEGEGGTGGVRGLEPAGQTEESRVEGVQGNAGVRQLEGMEVDRAPEGSAVIFKFSGVTNDGEPGATIRAEATAVHCTNIGAEAADVVIEVWQWDGNNIYYAERVLIPNGTITVSTQDTEIYFEDTFLGGGSGTGPINQGFGRVLSTHEEIVCTAQVLDPAANPPTYISGLELFR